MTKKLSEIRGAFLDYFAQNNHEIIKSAPLIPHNDPSLMFVNAGMVPFKNYFTAVEEPKFKRVVSSQKCVRAGGKHNDLENVGYTARHHTFFEMLGNFSFGDYFKEEAIFYAWEFITKILALPKDRLIVTIYHDDDEAFALWRKISGLAEHKIKRISTNDNFWSMGDTGPCGPCSEIFYDHGDHLAGFPPGEGDEGDRFVEIWNLVFMQYEKKADGSKIKLPKPSIDTGMGLERITAIMQGKNNNFEVDLFQDIINESMKISRNDQDIVSHRVITDHLRSASFLIADGVLPDNEGRGYVLRRIMRRAMRHVHQLGYQGPLLSELFSSLQNRMGNHFTELNEASDLIFNTIAKEEEQFGKTLTRGLKILSEELSRKSSGKLFSGDITFKLYDTYGFPYDLTADILRNKNLTIDGTRFEQLMLEQKTRGKNNWKGSGASQDNDFWFKLNNQIGASEFTGYQNVKDKAHIKAIIIDEQKQDLLKSGKAIIITDKTPFYAESGGQLGDLGIIKTNNSLLEVYDTQKIAQNLIGHLVELKSGEIKVNDTCELIIDQERRNKIKSNHSATHLMHKALQEILGKHVAQKGSYVGADILRFDFTHHKQLTISEIRKVEIRVNEIIRQNNQVKTELMDIDMAKEAGAMALFGEKYAEKVRVLTMGKKDNNFYSKELCGGTHVEYTGDIAIFKIINESSIASGVRRIEAITGEKIFEHIYNYEDIITNAANLVKAPKNELLKNIQTLQTNKKSLEKQIAKLQQEKAIKIADHEIIKSNDSKILFKKINDIDSKNTRELLFKFRDQDFDLIILVTSCNEKAGIMVFSGDIDKYNAVSIVQKIVAKLGGKGGGGKADLAQGGAPDTSNISALTLDEIF
ncbi:MAG: alanine--tRNA ligase [Alphaproteobacteria bacterium]|jgi:alanyl-tRNA synthetase|nr:alanine--tRNA ligase [Alphaproteobacteria bacterium]